VNKPTDLVVQQNMSSAALMMDTSALDRMERFATLMASARSTVPAHFQGKTGDCLAVVMQATTWGMNPFAVAQKTHVINGVLGYEAQLVASVINSSNMLVDRFNFEWFGAWEKIVGKFKTVESKTKKDDNGNFKKYIVPDWDTKDEQGLGVRVWATIKGESEPRVLELLMTQARVRNSTLWTEDPKQQLAYLAQKRWARLYAPDVILGVYTPDEIAEHKEIFMGMAEVVTKEADAPLPAYDDAKFAHNLKGSWQKRVNEGGNVNDLLTMLKSRNSLTAEQEAAILSLKAVIENEPSLTAEQIEQKLNDAKDVDALYVAADLINQIKDAERAASLNTIFNERLTALKGGEA
jgi:hypothetical protein